MGATVKRVKMAAMLQANQTIVRLTPLAEVLAAIDVAARPVAAREVGLAAARGRILAADVVAPTALPAAPLALHDGWAVNAEATRDAGGYAPAPLQMAPPRIEAGQPMPKGTDAVAPFESIRLNGGHAEALAPVAPGEGVLRAEGDCGAESVLRRAGTRLRDGDIAVFASAGVSHLRIREPRLSVIPVRQDSIVAASAQLVVNDAERFGSAACLESGADIDRALRTDVTDAFVIIGGTGSGRNDKSVQALAHAGRVLVHGIALTPGETGGFGVVGTRPVLLVPGRLDAALSVWLTLGRTMLARLAGLREDEQSVPAALTRKISSTVNITEFVPVRRDGNKAEPLATQYLPLSAIAQADGWVLVPAESEGYQAGSTVSVRPWP